MSDKSVFDEDQWRAVVEAPLLVTVTMFAAGQHGPISMVKESAASARLIATPGDRGAANALIAQIVPEAEAKESRHDVGHRKGASIQELIVKGLADLEPAAAAIANLPADEAAGVGGWLVDIAKAVAAASKGTSDVEAETIAKIAALFGVATD